MAPLWRIAALSAVLAARAVSQSCRASSCYGCTAQANCAWCVENGNCSPVQDVTNATCTDVYVGFCPVDPTDPCLVYDDCVSCEEMGAGCGWCNDNGGACLSGDAYGPFVLLCTAGNWYQPARPGSCAWLPTASATTTPSATSTPSASATASATGSATPTSNAGFSATGSATATSSVGASPSASPGAAEPQPAPAQFGVGSLVTVVAPLSVWVSGDCSGSEMDFSDATSPVTVPLTSPGLSMVVQCSTNAADGGSLFYPAVSGVQLCAGGTCTSGVFPARDATDCMQWVVPTGYDVVSGTTSCSATLTGLGLSMAVVVGVVGLVVLGCLIVGCVSCARGGKGGSGCCGTRGQAAVAAARSTGHSLNEPLLAAVATDPVASTTAAATPPAGFVMIPLTTLSSLLAAASQGAAVRDRTAPYGGVGGGGGGLYPAIPASAAVANGGSAPAGLAVLASSGTL